MRVIAKGLAEGDPYMVVFRIHSHAIYPREIASSANNAPVMVGFDKAAICFARDRNSRVQNLRPAAPLHKANPLPLAMRKGVGIGAKIYIPYSKCSRHSQSAIRVISARNAEGVF